MTSSDTTAPHAACIGPSDARIIGWMTQLGEINFRPGQVEALIEAADSGHQAPRNYSEACDIVLGIATSRAAYIARLTTHLAGRVDALTAELAEAREHAARLEGRIWRMENDPDE